MARGETISAGAAPGAVGLLAGANLIGSVGITGAIPAGNNLIGKTVPGFANPTQGAGILTAPAAAAVVADTGPLAAGAYRVEVSISFADTALAGKGLSVEHRNAANGANITTLDGCAAPDSLCNVWERVVIALNERIRVVNQAVAGAAGSKATGAIRAYLLP